MLGNQEVKLKNMSEIFFWSTSVFVMKAVSELVPLIARLLLRLCLRDLLLRGVVSIQYINWYIYIWLLCISLTTIWASGAVISTDEASGGNSIRMSCWQCISVSGWHPPHPSSSGYSSYLMPSPACTNVVWHGAWLRCRIIWKPGNLPGKHFFRC